MQKQKRPPKNKVYTFKTIEKPLVQGGFFYGNFVGIGSPLQRDAIFHLFLSNLNFLRLDPIFDTSVQSNQHRDEQRPVYGVGLKSKNMLVAVKTLAQKSGQILQKFRDDVRGGITAFTVVSFLTMFLAVGMGVDFIRFEANRAELQDALDRGVLAAASSGADTTEEITEVIEGYLRSTNYVGEGYQLVINNQSTFATRDIRATLSYATETMALKLAGIKDLAVSAKASAYQGVSDIEISLALDISGSMARERTGTSPSTLDLLNNYSFPSKLSFQGNHTQASRLDVLRVAADQFIDTILNTSNSATTTISLVPFSGQVNAGQAVFNKLRSSHAHGYSRCIEFTSSDFTTTSLPGYHSRSQVPHFQWFRFEAAYGHQAEWGWCPSNDQEIEYFSNDASKLKTRISDFTGHDGTGTQIAMKWALGLLDPSFNAVVPDLVAANKMSSDFGDRPYAFNDTDTMKVIVLMSDGGTTYQQRPVWYKYNSNSERRYLARNYLPSSWTTLRYTSDRTNSQNQARANLLSTCAQANDNDVIVFTIGFDLITGSTAQTDLANCASTPNHHFDVDGKDLSEAFRQVAVSISKLKLTQ